MNRPIMAALALVACTALLVPGSGALGSEARHAARPVDASSLKPAIVGKRIPFGTKRKRQMAAYSKRHYGEPTSALTDPHVAVEHYTDGPSSSSACTTFAANSLHLD